MTVKFQNQKLLTLRTRPDSFKYPLGLNGGGPDVNSFVNAIGTPAFTASPASNKVIPGANGNIVIQMTTSGSFTLEDGVGDQTGSMLIVAGGGGSQPNGSSGHTPGAGAGGLNYITGLTFTQGTTYPVTVGAGGAVSQDGDPSSITIDSTPYSVTGGGRGGPASGAAGQPGGSGGGGAPGIPGQGYPGGARITPTPGINASGATMGGGGAGGSGGPYNGGAARFFNISGELVGYAGGGGSGNGSEAGTIYHEQQNPQIYDTYGHGNQQYPGNFLGGGGHHSPPGGAGAGGGAVNRGGGAGGCFGGVSQVGVSGGSGVVFIELDVKDNLIERNTGPGFGL